MRQAGQGGLSGWQCTSGLANASQSPNCASYPGGKNKSAVGNTAGTEQELHRELLPAVDRYNTHALTTMAIGHRCSWASAVLGICCS